MFQKHGGFVFLDHRLPLLQQSARGGSSRVVHSDLQPGGPFLTKYGLATELPSSIKYMADGYWRGPIWAASTYLIFQGLLECEEYKLAKLIAQRFCDLVQQEPGFWENYDALTGTGLRCPGYSWTASIFLLLAEWLEDQAGEKSSI